MKDEHTYGKKMARKGRTKVIYKGTFISKQSLERGTYHLQKGNISDDKFSLPQSLPIRRLVI